MDDLKRNVRIPNYMFDKNDDGYYNSLSAFQKSIRGSDVDAALYYLARLCEAEDLISIERRLLVIAYEDIGLGNPNAVDRTFNAIETAKKVGFPEAIIPLSFAVIDLALSPKSKSAYLSIAKAVELYKMINPIEHSRTKDSSRKYKVEPYVIAADVYGAKNMAGRGGWTWYTGSSSWFLKAGLEDILGLKIEAGNLKIEPCISSKWEKYSIKYRYKTSVYNINVKNPEGKCTGENQKFYFNGKEVQEKQIKLEDNNSINEIEVIL